MMKRRLPSHISLVFHAILCLSASSVTRANLSQRSEVLSSLTMEAQISKQCRAVTVKSGCAFFSGEQVNGEFPNTQAVGTISYEFDSTFSHLNYSLQVEDPVNSMKDLEILNLGLYCGFAGSDEETDEYIAPLARRPQGSLVTGQIMTAGDFGAPPVICGAVQIDTIAALYQAMRKDQVYIYGTILDMSPQSNATLTSIRGQIFMD